MTRDEAYKLVLGRLGDTHLFWHCLAAEACMRALSHRLGGDPDLFGLTGLVHDLDLDECENDMDQHALVGAEILREQGAPAEVIDAVLGHNGKAQRTTVMAKTLWVVDLTTGMIAASALVRPSKSTVDLNIKSIKKRMKDNRFAANINREQIRACEKEIGLPLDDFLTICLEAMNGIRDQIGL